MADFFLLEIIKASVGAACKIIVQGADHGDIRCGKHFSYGRRQGLDPCVQVDDRCSGIRFGQDRAQETGGLLVPQTLGEGAQSVGIVQDILLIGGVTFDAAGQVISCGVGYGGKENNMETPFNQGIGGIDRYLAGAAGDIVEIIYNYNGPYLLHDVS